MRLCPSRMGHKIIGPGRSEAYRLIRKVGRVLLPTHGYGPAGYVTRFSGGRSAGR